MCVCGVCVCVCVCVSVCLCVSVCVSVCLCERIISCRLEGMTLNFAKDLCVTYSQRQMFTLKLRGMFVLPFWLHRRTASAVTDVLSATSIFPYTSELQRRIQAMEIWCYRKILSISCKDHVTNEEVHAKIQQSLGPHKDLLTIIKRQKMQW